MVPRNRNLSKVGTGTVKNSYGSTTLDLRKKYATVKEKPEEGAGPSHPDRHLFAAGSRYFRQVLQIPK
jgi:hypothetical protein